MLKKGSKLYSILTGSCPRCHQESMYIDKNPYHLSKLYDMHENCSHCELQYKIEPSFFYGAMYVSYALTVAIGVATFIIGKVFIGLDLIESFIAIIAALLLLTPITARLSRNIYINIFVHYNPEATKNVHND
ncbi:DUF983 domain-containing protein [Flavobacterium capsici]|uniref:DUF983 domain-containing protein n=1 Tax=Flavobacterium capsici TaxID=3075618 RepID=A0AA96F371_9FLAO|nr:MULTISPECIES: DUF983 domain-containing protein [unclassified Flavobacterium]WNM19142.1 DUF983 domain-containing protein [Flavobacterium sp. PMR2A8]WNM20531.1 DUF983 domain-containing protein [Flavobacterium sp. PMTSA4]